MIKCNFCKSKIEDGYLICPNCGKELPKRVSPIVVIIISMVLIISMFICLSVLSSMIYMIEKDNINNPDVNIKVENTDSGLNDYELYIPESINGGI